MVSYYLDSNDYRCRADFAGNDRVTSTGKWFIVNQRTLSVENLRESNQLNDTFRLRFATQDDNGNTESVIFVQIYPNNEGSDTIDKNVDSQTSGPTFNLNFDNGAGIPVDTTNPDRGDVVPWALDNLYSQYGIIRHVVKGFYSLSSNAIRNELGVFFWEDLDEDKLDLSENTWGIGTRDADLSVTASENLPFSAHVCRTALADCLNWLVSESRNRLYTPIFGDIARLAPP